MKAIINDSQIRCYPTGDEVSELCRPGAGADTCIWLTMRENGLECVYFIRPSALEEMWRDGETTAKRDGCEKMKTFSPTDYSEKEVTF